MTDMFEVHDAEPIYKNLDSFGFLSENVHNTTSFASDEHNINGPNNPTHYASTEPSNYSPPIPWWASAAAPPMRKFLNNKLWYLYLLFFYFSESALYTTATNLLSGRHSIDNTSTYHAFAEPSTYSPPTPRHVPAEEPTSDSAESDSSTKRESNARMFVNMSMREYRAYERMKSIFSKDI